MTNLSKHVICAISGGVDSAISAYFLKQQGYKVTGCFMRNWNTLDENVGICSADCDEEDAKQVCNKLNIPFISVDFSKNYWNRIFSKFLNEYEEGLTPNPDILCNKYVKFPSLLQYCTDNIKDFDYIATGHYSQLEYDQTLRKYRLLKGRDELKDQSFFLSQISSELLGRVIFPVGHMHKSEVRKLAKNIGLQKISKKSSSVGICFIGKRKFADFIGSYLPERHGLIMDIESKTILGDHSGIYKFTLGQRIPIGDKVNTLKQPYFVAKKDLTTNVIYVVKGTNHPALYHNSFMIEKPYWICDNKELSTSEHIILNENYQFKFQHRHYQSPILSLEKIFNNSLGDFVYKVKTKHNIRGITPGQFAVFYDENECIGSAKIIQTCESLYEQNYTGLILNSDKLLNKRYK